jgi:hypothetical protein
MRIRKAWEVFKRDGIPDLPTACEAVMVSFDHISFENAARVKGQIDYKISDPEDSDNRHSQLRFDIEECLAMAVRLQSVLNQLLELASAELYVNIQRNEDGGRKAPTVATTEALVKSNPTIVDLKELGIEADAIVAKWYSLKNLVVHEQEKAALFLKTNRYRNT